MFCRCLLTLFLFDGKKMEIPEEHIKSLQIINTEIIDKNILESLLENCCQSLSGKNYISDITTLSDTNKLELNQLYASLLYTFAQFVRNSQSKEEFSNFLSKECNLEINNIKILEGFYDKWNKSIRVQLLNIGNHLPHITDVRWKIDYIVKSNALDQAAGPIFRVSLKTEKYNEMTQAAKKENIEFTCTSQELQDLVYKLKDAARHCQMSKNSGRTLKFCLV